MSKKIFKYKIETTDAQIIEMPKCAQILCVQTQNEIPCIWALCDSHSNADVSNRTILIFGTGHHIPEEANLYYIGTYQLNGGQLVFHCFELLGGA